MMRSSLASGRARAKGAGVGQALILLLALCVAAAPAARAESAGAEAAAQDPPARVGRIAAVTGTVSFRAGGQDQWAAAELNRPLTSGDGLWTELGAHAVVEIGPAALRLDQGTELEVDRIDLHAAALRLPQGSVNVRLAQLAEGDSYELATPRGTVALRGAGLYRIDAGSDREPTRVVAFRGRAGFSGQSSDFAIEPGQSVEISGDPGGNGRLAYAVHPAEAGPLDRWAASLDQGPAVAPDASATARYVSPQATGYQDLDRYGTWNSAPDYGAVWYPAAVPVGWAPYRYGHWAWVPPWGWTWIDDAPWGFTPFHYGRWVFIGERWAWVPGLYVARPVYAPALVVFVGGGSIVVVDAAPPAIGWIPLAPGEVFIPPFRCSPTFIQQVNITNVNKVVINQVINRTVVVNKTVETARSDNRAGGVPAVARRPDGFANRRALTLVAHRDFVAAKPVAKTALPAASAQLRTAMATDPALPGPEPGQATDRRSAPKPPAIPTAAAAPVPGASPVPRQGAPRGSVTAAPGPSTASVAPALVHGAAPGPRLLRSADRAMAPGRAGAPATDWNRSPHRRAGPAPAILRGDPRGAAHGPAPAPGLAQRTPQRTAPVVAHYPVPVRRPAEPAHPVHPMVPAAQPRSIPSVGRAHVPPAPQAAAPAAVPAPAVRPVQPQAPAQGAGWERSNGSPGGGPHRGDQGF